MSNERKNKDKAMAAYMKDRGITRTTGMCPMGCGRPLPVGGGALLAHVGQCKGSPRRSRT